MEHPKHGKHQHTSRGKQNREQPGEVRTQPVWKKKKVRHQTNRDAGEKMGALSSKKGRNFTNTHKMQCEATLPRTQQPKRTQYESYHYRLNAKSARAS